MLRGNVILQGILISVMIYIYYEVHFYYKLTWRYTDEQNHPKQTINEQQLKHKTYKYQNHQIKYIHFTDLSMNKYI